MAGSSDNDPEGEMPTIREIEAIESLLAKAKLIGAIKLYYFDIDIIKDL